MESVKKFEVVWDGEIIFMVSQSDFDRETTGLEQRRYAEQQARVAAERRVEEMEGLLRQASMLILDAELLRAIESTLTPTAEAVSHE